MRLNSLFIILSTSFLIFLSACTSLTVYRELRHENFTVQYPNWGAYKLEKFEDDTFKAVTTDKQGDCRVLVSAYTTNYLSVASVILTSIQESSSLGLVNKYITKDVAIVEYTVNQPQEEQVKLLVFQCKEYAYVAQYTCRQDVFSKREEAIAKVLDSVQCKQ